MFPCADAGGYRRYGFKMGDLTHTGHDFNARIGTPVKAVAPGVVISASQINGFGSILPKPGTRGGAVFILHTARDGTKFVALYGHVNYKMSNGTEVKEGDVIGTIADFTNNGESWPHLHFGVYVSNVMPLAPYGYSQSVGNWVDPVAFIKKKLL